MKFNSSDKKIYLALLKLLKDNEPVTISNVANKASVTKGLIYYKINNLYLFDRPKSKERRDYE